MPTSRPASGYLSPRWSLRSAGDLVPCVAAGVGHELDVVKRHQAVGSRVYLNFAAQGDLIESFFVPRAAPATSDAPRRNM